MTAATADFRRCQSNCSWHTAHLVRVPNNSIPALDLYCAQNAFSNLLGLSREDDDQLRAQADPKMHIKAYGGMLDKHSSYFRLVQVDKNARKATRSPPDKLKWLLDTTAQGGYKNEDPLHTGCMLVGVGAHVVGWDTRAGLLYDPYTDIEVALPATQEVVDALHLNQIDFFTWWSR